MSKYSYLASLAKLMKNANPTLTLAEISRKLIELENLKETPEQLRKALSRELGKFSTNIESSNLTTTSSSNAQVTIKIFNRKDKFTEPGNYVLLGCVHVPGHNESMINGITKLLGDIKDLKGLMLMGDFLDLNSLSGHDRGRFTAIKDLTLDEEYETGNKILNQLVNQLPKSAEKLYLYGNHEDRWNRYMADMQNAKTPLLSPAEALGLEKKGFNVFTNWSSDFVTLGEHLELIHGQYFNTHCAKQHIDKFRGSIAFVHTHRIQMYVEGKTGGFNIGWGGNVNHPFFNYAERGTKSQWQNGFAIVTVDEKGDYYVQQILLQWKSL